MYGTALGGTSGGGMVFELIPPAVAGGAWTVTVLYNFTGQGGDGAGPAGVAIGAQGVLYGVTGLGGTSSSCSGGCGTVFSLSPPASSGGAWTESVLHSFGRNDGYQPVSVAIGSGGVLYGMTWAGGTSANCGAGGCGTAFSLTPPAAAGGSWTETVLHDFTSQGGDGSFPLGALVTETSGRIYGTTKGGGGAGCPQQGGCGTAFVLTPPASPGGVWTETVLHHFPGQSGGGLPSAGLVIGESGVLYGTTYSGGTSGYGTVFSLAP
jgi:uncharacterized repeat protein (TIGR03803 family)